MVVPKGSYFVCGGTILPGVESKALRREIGQLGFNLEVVSTGFDLGNRKVISVFRVICKEEKKDFTFFPELKQLLVIPGFYLLSYAEQRQSYLASTFEKVGLFWHQSFLAFFLLTFVLKQLRGYTKSFHILKQGLVYRKNVLELVG